MDGGGNMLPRSGLANTLADPSKLQQVSMAGGITQLALIGLFHRGLIGRPTASLASR